MNTAHDWNELTVIERTASGSMTTVIQDGVRIEQLGRPIVNRRGTTVIAVLLADDHGHSYTALVFGEIQEDEPLAGLREGFILEGVRAISPSGHEVGLEVGSLSRTNEYETRIHSRIRWADSAN